MAEKFCVKCGKELIKPKNAQRYCETCRAIAAEEVAKKAAERFNEKKNEKPKKIQKKRMTLDEAAAEAKSLGMTYGQWQAMQYGVPKR